MRIVNWFKSLFKEDVVLSDWVQLHRYYCIEMNAKIDGVYQAPIRYLPNSQALMKFLSLFGTKAKTAWDLNSDGVLNTPDMMALIAGYGTTPDPNPSLLPLDLFELFGEFGEGNNWFNPLAPIQFNGEDVSFLWYHTTPYDESDVFIKDSPRSFDIDVVLMSGNIFTFTFVER